MIGNIRTFVLMAAMTALVMGMGWLIGGLGGAVIALVIAGAGNIWAWWNSDKALLRQAGAVRVDAQSAPELVALVAALALTAPAIANRLVHTQRFAGMTPVYRAVANQPHVLTAQVMRGWSSMNGGGKTHSLQAALQLDAPLTEDGAMAKRIAQQMAKADPQIASEDVVVVVLAYGYDMGIATGWRRHGYSFGVGELR